MYSKCDLGVVTIFTLFTLSLNSDPSLNTNSSTNNETFVNFQEQDFVYTNYGCLMDPQKFSAHKGTKLFGQACTGNGGPEDCLLLSPKTVWRYKDFVSFSDGGVGVEIEDCRRKSNLVCHWKIGRCYCSAAGSGPEYFLYDRGEMTCLIRPGFPCVNEYECSQQTVCTVVNSLDMQWDKECTCDIRWFNPFSTDTSIWDNWFCADENIASHRATPLDYSSTFIVALSLGLSFHLYIFKLSTVEYL